MRKFGVEEVKNRGRIATLQAVIVDYHPQWTPGNTAINAGFQHDVHIAVVAAILDPAFGKS